jgi:putative endonuclease
MTATRLRLGRRAEEIVARWLSEKGWRILARNARTRFGELDIVVLDGKALVFLEVKAGREGAAAGPERPILSVGPRKQQRIRRLATAWMAEHRDGPRYVEIRFDVVGVSFDRDGSLSEVEHIPNAF